MKEGIVSWSGSSSLGRALRCYLIYRPVPWALAVQKVIDKSILKILYSLLLEALYVQYR
jgi:hypothetical protein